MSLTPPLFYNHYDNQFRPYKIQMHFSCVFTFCGFVSSLKKDFGRKSRKDASHPPRDHHFLCLTSSKCLITLESILVALFFFQLFSSHFHHSINVHWTQVDHWKYFANFFCELRGFSHTHNTYFNAILKIFTWHLMTLHYNPWLTGFTFL